MIVHSPAKINWFLHVLKKRDDGYHEIISPMQKVSLFDTLSFELSEDIQLFDNSNIHDNIVLKVIKALNDYRTQCNRGISIRLKKSIPLAAGLGGGSSNAAASIVTLNRLWKLDLTAEEMHAVASKIGSDVPFFLGDGLAIVRGRGEEIELKRAEQQFDILLINPGIRISARWAYENTSHFSDIRNAEDIVDGFMRALTRRDYIAMREYMFNGLEVPVYKQYPEIKEIQEKLRREGARLSLMSGSGSTVYGVFEDEEGAEKARKQFSALWTAVVKTLN